jgi:phosphatidylethanolamine/phosphatidyl-N-methylethanolamine N-methyltransferase
MIFGDFDTEIFVEALKEKPELISEVMHWDATMDLVGLRKWLNLKPKDIGVNKPLNRNYLANKTEIDRIIKTEAWPTVIENTHWLDTNHVREVYDTNSWIYDGVWSTLYPFGREGIFNRLYPVGKEETPTKTGDASNILEVGIGSGRHLPFYLTHTTITGIDNSPSMLGIAKARVKNFGGDGGNVTLDSMDMHELDYDDETFDGVAMSFSLSSCTEPEKALSEAIRVCKPGGNILMFDNVLSEHDEVKAVQYLLRPIAREFGVMFMEDIPPKTFPIELCLDAGKLFDSFDTKIGVESTKVYDPIETVKLFSLKRS